MNLVFACIPTRDGVPNHWVAKRVSEACRPIGATWGHTTNHLSVCTSRNQAVALAIGRGVSHLFMCDNDTYIPPDAIVSLLAQDADIATGVTPTTFRSGSEPAVPCINVADEVNEYGQPQFFREWFSGRREVQWCGAACILVRMEVFHTIGFPWWQMDQSWDGHHYKCFSEDLSFCRRVREAGYSIIADGDVRCLHDRKVECGALIPEAVYG